MRLLEARKAQQAAGAPTARIQTIPNTPATSQASKPERKWFQKPLPWILAAAALWVLYDNLNPTQTARGPEPVETSSSEAPAPDLAAKGSVATAAPKESPSASVASPPAGSGPSTLVVPLPKLHAVRRHRASRLAGLKPPAPAEVGLPSPLRPETPQPASKHYFTLGSTKDEVLAVQGTPTGVQNYPSLGDVWNYEFSSVDFTTDGVVKGYSNISHNLRVKGR